MSTTERPVELPTDRRDELPTRPRADVGMNEATIADQDADRQRLTFFGTGGEGELFETETMSFPEFPEGIPETLEAEGIDISPLAVGNDTTVLFKGKGPDGLSLASAWFAPNFLLPRHSHDSDCLYYIVRGTITMGSRTLGAGEGFYINADGPYAYQAGPDGAEVLEFRRETSFDMKIYERNVDRWRVIADVGAANAESWAALRAERDASKPTDA